MPISFRWQDDTHRLLLITFEGPWTWEDLFSTAQACNDTILGEPHPVCIIADTLGMDGIPAGNLVEIGMRLVRQYVAPNAAILVLVTVHPLLRSTGLALKGIFQTLVTDLAIAPDMARAQAIVAQKCGLPHLIDDAGV